MHPPHCFIFSSFVDDVVNRVCKTSSIKETLLRTSLAWSTKITDRRTGNASMRMKPGDASYQFVQPPKHVAEAMERLRSTQISSSLHKWRFEISLAY